MYHGLLVKVRAVLSMTAISCCRCIQPPTLERPWLHVYARSDCMLSLGCDVHLVVVVVVLVACRCSGRTASPSAAIAAIVLVLVGLTACRPSFVQLAAAPSSSSPAAVRRRMSIGFSRVPVHRRRW